MKKFLLAILVICCLCSVSWAAKFTADEFVPIVQAPDDKVEELSTVKNPEAVVTSEDTVFNAPVTHGMSDQDSINAIAQRHEDGCEMVAMSYGGYGFVATGSGTYRKNMTNLTALRIAQRNANVQALMDAKRKMAGMVEGLAVEGFTNFDENITTFDTDKEEERKRNREANNSERNKEIVASVIKGFVTYSIFDDFNNGTVYVTIVSTPKSRGAFNRVTTNTIDADTLNGGLNAVLAEIQSNLVPLVGGRVVEVPATGEIAFVGFGSAVVRQDDDPSIRNALLRAARQTASMRANSALCGIILGDEVHSETAVDEVTKESVRDTKKIEQEDPITGLVSSKEVANAEGRQTQFRNRMEFRQVIESAIRNTLPPGVKSRAWLDDNGEFAYALAIYIPSISDAAASSAKEMRETQIVRPVDPNAGRNSHKTENNTAPDTPDYKDSGEFRPGATGIINQSL